MYKLIIADDEVVEREAIRFFIRSAGYAFDVIEEVSNGIQAVQKAKEVLPHIIIMDIKMPGKDGLEAAREIRRFHSDCNIIFLTAFNEFDYAHQAIKVKAEDFIIKPANRDNLIKVLGRVMSNLDKKKALADKTKDLEQRAFLFTRWFENDLMLSVAKGYILESHLTDYFSKMEICFDTAVCATLHYKPGRDTQYSQDRIRERIKTIISRQCQENNIRYLMGYARKCIYVMCLTECGKQGWADTLFAQINQVIQENMNIDVQIGIGKVFYSPEGASNSFFQAKFASKRNNRSGRVVSFENIEEINAQYPLDEEKKLCDVIIKGDENAAEKSIEEIMDWISQFSGSLDWIKEEIHELITVIDRSVIKEFNIRSVLLQDRFTELQNLNSMNEIIVMFKNIVTEIIICINSINNSPSELLIDKACDYIDRNYEKDISLDMMGKMLGFSKYYFSKLFKQCKNVNFADYITAKRMQRAKELLSNIKFSMKEISAEIGYNDPNYFTNVFKKWEGISPTEYRRKHMA